MKKEYQTPYVEMQLLDCIETTEEVTPSVNVDFNEWN